MSSESSDSKKSPSNIKKEKPNFLPKRKLFWGTVENVFDLIGAMFLFSAGVIGINFLWNFTLALLALFRGSLNQSSEHEIPVFLLAESCCIFFLFEAIFLSIRPNCFYNRLMFFLIWSIASFCGFPVILYFVYQMSRDFEFIYFYWTYIAIWVTAPFVLFTSAFCAFALYKTRKIKIPRFYDGPDLYEVIYDAENSSTKPMEQRELIL